MPAEPAPAAAHERPEPDPDATLAEPFGGKWGAEAAKRLVGTHEMFFVDPAQANKASSGTSSRDRASRDGPHHLGGKMWASKSDDPNAKDRREIPAENLLGPRRWGKTMHYRIVSREEVSSEEAKAIDAHEMTDAKAFFKLFKGPSPALQRAPSTMRRARGV